MEQLFELVAPCHFGLEAVLKREVQRLGYEITEVEDGRVTFRGPASSIARANIFLRTAERILLKVGAFHAETFDELFEGVRRLPWERILPRDAKFWVTKASTSRSKLFSQTAIQSIVKKAMVDRMKETWLTSVFPEDGDEYPVRVFIFKDEVTVGLDTSGISLHKRGYRKLVGKAPVSETLAAALLMLTPWHADRILVDPFCGSGTFLIEAAMMGAGIAPGVNRDFTAQNWTKFMDRKLWYEAADEALSMEKHDVKMQIRGYDKDPEIIAAAMKNAEDAGVREHIHFQAHDVAELSSPKSYGFIVTNPPYGERLSDKDELFSLYRVLGDRFRSLSDWSLYVLSSYADTEKAIGQKAAKNRKIYNGMIEARFYQFPGKKPPGRKA